MKTQEKATPYNVENQLKEYKVNRISTIEEIDEIYDYEMMLKTNDLSVRDASKINFILFDSPIQERTFLLETFTEYIDENGEVMEHVIVSYCDNKIVYDELFKKYFMLNEIQCDGDCGVPIILVVNGIDDEIIFEMETFAPISIKTFENIFDAIN